uniref:Ig-like domain-containing protein n=1 Tax=Laticauda laticaudata TaxID=8630 RepID=A0A8C5SXU7_LATLA
MFSYIYSLLECSDANIIQKQSMMLEEGQDVRLVCIQDYGHCNMLWFRQHKQQQDLQLLYNFYNGGIVQKIQSSHRLNANQPTLDCCFLSISVVKPEDSALYFCASSETTVHQNTVFFLQKSSPFVSNLESCVVPKTPWSSQPGSAM